MKTKVLLVVAVLTFLCTACAGAVAAPEPAATPDLLREELEEKVLVCRLTPYQYLATIPVGERVGSIMFHWVVAGADPTHIHTIRVTEETWKGLVGYETFHFVSTYELTRSVTVDIVVNGRRVVFSPSVADCPPPAPKLQA